MDQFIGAFEEAPCLQYLALVVIHNSNVPDPDPPSEHEMVVDYLVSYIEKLAYVDLEICDDTVSSNVQNEWTRGHRWWKKTSDNEYGGHTGHMIDWETAMNIRKRYDYWNMPQDPFEFPEVNWDRRDKRLPYFVRY